MCNLPLRSGWAVCPGMIAVPLFMLVVARLHIDFEEFELHKRFGAQWEHYTKQVRRWL